MTGSVAFVADVMLPASTLPDAAPAVRDPPFVRRPVFVIPRGNCVLIDRQRDA